MDTLTPKTQEQAGMPPGKAFWKSLAMVGITSLVVWSAIWIFVGLREGFQDDEWFIGFILILFTVLLLTPLVYYNYRRGPIARKYSRRANILIGICYAGLGVGETIVGLRWPPTHHSRYVVFAVSWLVLAAIYFYRAFKREDTASIPS